MRCLTARQNAAVKRAAARWLEWIYSTEPADREQAEAGVRQTYRAAGMAEPEIFLWFEDLMEALVVTEQLSDFREVKWMLPPEAVPRREEARRRVRDRLGLRTWNQVLRVTGTWYSRFRHEEKRHLGLPFMVAVPREDSLQARLQTAPDDQRTDCEAIEEAAAAVGVAARRASCELEAIVQQAARPGIPGHVAIGSLPTVYQDYQPDLLFRHYCLLTILGEQTSVVYDGLRLTVQHCGPWWAFKKAAVLCDRPRVACRDDEMRLHNDKGPALIFRNGVECFAWHGAWIPEEAIFRPQAITRAAIRAEHGATRRALVEIYGVERYEREQRPPPRKRTNALVAVLPASPDEKIEALRDYGPLPYYNQYVAGEHQKVWDELLRLGAAVREGQYAADALAVAYATMIRVRQNIATLIERLGEMGYEFEVETHGPGQTVPFGVERWNVWTGAKSKRPGPLAAPDVGLASLKRLERDAGEMPISLRAWYEVVGSVTLAGKHPTLPARCADALLVMPFSQTLRDWDESPTDVGVGGQAFVAEIAPEQSYRITLPCPMMDGVITKGLCFVDYLRLAFEWGGFPGLVRLGLRPKEIEALSQSLMAI